MSSMLYASPDDTKSWQKCNVLQRYHEIGGTTFTGQFMIFVDRWQLCIRLVHKFYHRNDFGKRRTWS